MREPRFRFPDQVRSTTRSMASRMVRDATVPHTPEELDAWIAASPADQQALQQGGYGTRFGAQDLLPLLQVMAQKAGGPAPPGQAPPPRRRGLSWPVALALLLLALLIAALAAGVLG